ncbi:MULTISPECIES: hypothetical protein [unclassified Streptomyces]|uniref:hypothetical protein n=1 Tax=unclassified Streptomyces TaxID=2593676 RepID=UPI00380EE615
MCAASSTPMDGETITLMRREDMVVLDFTFAGLARTGTAGSVVLVPSTPGQPGFITVHFPSQAVLEEATTLAASSTGTKEVRYADESRVTFQVPADASVPFTVAGLLAWTGLSMSRSGTSLECVWGLFLSPTTDVTWTHGTDPVTSSTGATGLWYTRLTSSPAPVPLDSAGPARTEDPFLSSLMAVHRQQITAATADRPVFANGLTLSALGADVDLVGNWADFPALGVTAYRHRSAGGRDLVVQVLERGYLLPFGFPVQVATRTERQLDLGLVQVVRLTVLQPEITYDGVATLPHGSRAFPFVEVRLNSPLEAEIGNTEEPLDDVGYWVHAADQPDQRLLFALTATDRLGHRVDFTSPLVFIRGDAAYGGLAGALVEYEAKSKDIPLSATGRLELAPAEDTNTESSTVDVAVLCVGAEPSTASSASLQQAGRLAAHPRLLAVDARIPALEALTAPTPSASAAPAGVTGAVRRLELDADYVSQGLAATHQVYARLPAPVAFAPPPAASGAIASLALPVSGLSSTAGLIGGNLQTFKSGQFKPADYFSPPTAGDLVPTRLLGVLDLTALIPPTTVGAGDGTDAPRMVTTVIRPPGDLQPPTAVRTELTWRPKVNVGTFGPLRTTDATTLELHGTTLVPFDGTPPQAEVRGELRSFALSFAGILDVGFDRMAFTGKPGTSPSLDVKVGKVGFSGDLRFLDRLREYLPSPPSGPRVKADTSGVEVGYGLAVPTIGAGVFLLQNLALSTTVFLPFDGSPVRASFAVASRDHPFLVTVSLFGGGGFFSITVESGHVVALEAQLEFGAAAALDLGVASGSVSVTAGAYIGIEEGKSKLRGFFRAVGALDVLGIVSVSVEFYLALETREVPKDPAAPYGPTRQEIHGTAAVTVRVRVAVFSQSVTLSVERSFGSGGDPTYPDAFPTATTWQERCAAFAPMEDV